MGRRKGEQWKQPQGQSFLRSVWDKKGLEELNRLWFRSHRMTLGQFPSLILSFLISKMGPQNSIPLIQSLCGAVNGIEPVEFSA